MRIIDTHAHLFDEVFAEDLEEIFKKFFLLPSTPDLQKCQREEKEKRHNPKVITAYSTI